MSTGTWGERSVSRCDPTSEPLDQATSVSRRRFAKASSEESSLLVVELHFEKENLGTEQMVLRRWYWPAVIIYCPPDTLVLFLQKLDKLLSNFAENVSAVNLLRDYNIERSL